MMVVSQMVARILLFYNVWILFPGNVFAFNGQLQFYPRGDQYLIVGSELRMNCSLEETNSTDFDLSKVDIKKGSASLDDVTFTRYTEDNVLGLTISNASVNDTGHYLCYYGRDETVKSLTVVNVAEMPGRPENITCVSYRLLDMTCTFNLTKPTNLPMKWQMEYRHNRKPPYRVNCSSITESEVHCDTVPINTLSKFTTYEVWVEGVNEKYQVNVNKSFEIFTNYSLARFGPVQDLNVTAGTRDVIIQWKRPEFAYFISSLVYEYKVMLHNDWQSFPKNVAGSKNKFEKITMDGLIPYMNYTVSVWGRPTGADGDIYWSDPSTQTILTLPDVPPYSVSMAAGSYSVWNCGQYMCAVLYWKNPEERYWYGEMVGYEIVIEPVSTLSASSTMVHTRSLVSDIRRHQVVVVNRSGVHDYLRVNTSLLKSDGYSLTVSLLNTEGKSNNGTKVSIPDWHTGQMLQVSWVAVEMSSSSDRVSWEIDAVLCSRIVSVTVYWCIGQPGNTTYIQCKGNFDWQTFNVEDGCKENVQHISNNLTNTEDFKYGVSIATDETSGGIQWEKFRFKNSKDVPERPLFSLNAEKASITVTILYNAYYVSDGGQPLMYHISYRKNPDQRTDCKNDGTKIDMPANFSQPEYKIDYLDSGTQYDVCVWSSNDMGNSVIWEPKSINTKKDWQVVIIVLAVVVPIILFAVIAIVLWCRRKRRRIIRENKNVKLPSLDFSVMDLTTAKDDNKELCLDQDSGKGDSPLTSLSNGFLNQAGCREEVVTESSVDMVVDTDGLSQNVLGHQVSPALSGYRQYLNGRIGVDALAESSSMLEWQDDDSEGFESSGNVDDDVDDDGVNTSTPTADSEYVDHDFPARKSTPPASRNPPAPRTPKKNSVSPLVQTTQPTNTQEYLPHAHMDARKHGTKTTIQSVPVSNIDHSYIDENRNPIASKQSYENPIFSNRREHIYYDIDEENDQLKSDGKADGVTRSGDAGDKFVCTDIPTSEHASSDQVHKSAESISVPQVDSYTVASSNQIQVHKSVESISVPQVDSYTVAYTAPPTGNPDYVPDSVSTRPATGISHLTHATGGSCKVYADGNNEIMDPEPKLIPSHDDNLVITETTPDDVAAIDESFSVDDDENFSFDNNSDRNSETRSTNNSSGNVFSSCSTDFKFGYKNPDSFSLGTVSTVSDVSDVGSIRSENLENESFSREMSPEIQSAKSAICQDIQALVEPNDVTNTELTISEVGNNLENQNQRKLGDDSSDKNSDSKYSACSNEDSSGNIFGSSSKDVNSMYKNPDSFSLGGGSTISDVSDVASVLSENLQNGSFSREMSPEKSAICRDIQTLTEPKEKLPMPISTKNHVELDDKIQLALDKRVKVVDDRTAGGDSSGTTSGETRLDSSDSYQVAGFASPNYSGVGATPTLDKQHKVVTDNLRNEFTHF